MAISVPRDAISISHCSSLFSVQTEKVAAVDSSTPMHERFTMSVSSASDEAPSSIATLSASVGVYCRDEDDEAADAKLEHDDAVRMGVSCRQGDLLVNVIRLVQR
jgi:hypothetical protein